MVMNLTLKHPHNPSAGVAGTCPKPVENNIVIHRKTVAHATTVARATSFGTMFRPRDRRKAKTQDV